MYLHVGWALNSAPSRCTHSIMQVCDRVPKGVMLRSMLAYLQGGNMPSLAQANEVSGLAGLWIAYGCRTPCITISPVSITHMTREEDWGTTLVGTRSVVVTGILPAAASAWIRWLTSACEDSPGGWAHTFCNIQ